MGDGGGEVLSFGSGRRSPVCRSQLFEFLQTFFEFPQTFHFGTIAVSINEINIWPNKTNLEKRIREETLLVSAALLRATILLEPPKFSTFLIFLNSINPDRPLKRSTGRFLLYLHFACIFCIPAVSFGFVQESIAGEIAIDV